MSAKYVRETYNVPAKRGMYVEVYRQNQAGEWYIVARGKITSFSRYIHIHLNSFHPTDNVVYYDTDRTTVLLDTREK